MSSLSFSLAGMGDVHTDSVKYTSNYKEAIEDLNKIITSDLPSYWISTETGTYEDFLEKYNAIKPTLDNVASMMDNYCATLQKKADDFETASEEAKSSFV